ncbi:hypothetical protein [Microbacterium sp.]|uniref:hypothetical protein n=1 Tax=Microbacterium sp. TaxID=51671 RepID=UPI003A928E68
MNLEELLAEADEILAAVEPLTVPVTLGKSTVGVRFLPMDGARWRGLTVKHPPRPDVPADMNRGYNIDAVVGAYPDVALIIGDTVDDMLRVQEDGTRVSAWPETWKRLTATGRDDVAAEMWSAHELIPEKLVDAEGKALAG